MSVSEKEAEMLDIKALALKKDYEDKLILIGEEHEAELVLVRAKHKADKKVLLAEYLSNLDTLDYTTKVMET